MNNFYKYYLIYFCINEIGKSIDKDHLPTGMSISITSIYYNLSKINKMANNSNINNFSFLMTDIIFFCILHNNADQSIHKIDLNNSCIHFSFSMNYNLKSKGYIRNFLVKNIHSFSKYYFNKVKILN